MTQDYKSLLQEVMEHKNYHTSEDHVITNGMGKRKPWKDKMRQLSADLNTLKSKMYAQDPACKDINMPKLEDNLNRLKNLVSTTVEDIQDADNKRGLFSDRTNKLCPQQIPKYAGTPSEDFIDFRDMFNRAMESNIISKTDQLG